VWNSVVEKIEGSGAVEKIVLKNVKTNEISDLKVAGVFMFVGQAPYDECVRGLVNAAKEGWILANDNMETSVEGIFAAGDVRSKNLRQVVTAASDGAIAAIGASSYINEQLHLRSVLLEPQTVTAFFYSSVDATQAHLSNEAEKFAKAQGKKLPIIDGYKNSRMAEKLGISSRLPAFVEVHAGIVSKVTSVSSEADIVSLLAP
jgi:thioredoxin reductase (NADPH)